MYSLNLPAFDYKVKKVEGKLLIFDSIRKKYVPLLPEEWVRQHFLHYLLENKKYPKSLIKVEGGLHYNERQKRTDIVIFDRNGSPWMIVECKAPEVAISQNSVFQASVYNSTLRAQYITVTNGLTHHFAQIDWQKGVTQWLESIPDFPVAENKNETDS
jgi:type I site-specific restriction endonuclease